jgi:hypothetical protein
MKIIDNFLTLRYADLIEEQLNSTEQEWYFNKNISYLDSGKNLNYGFSFHLYRTDTGFSTTNLTIFLRPLLLQIQDTVNSDTLLRGRVDMTVATGVEVKHDPHVDIPNVPNTTTIYYVSDSDGDTVVYNETRESAEYTVKDIVTPKKNRLLIFDGSHYHTGHSPMQHPNRILINANFI